MELPDDLKTLWNNGLPYKRMNLKARADRAMLDKARCSNQKP